METTPNNFIRQIVDSDLKSAKHTLIKTRFPPEPNGYLHIGHAKSICLNFGLARDFRGVCHLRFDDTNPTKEETEYVESIKTDVRWLGFDWGSNLFYASDYFEKLVLFGEELIKKGLAYVCELNAEEVRQYRGTLTETGKDSPWRNRPMQENLDLFRRMKAGEFEDGKYILRAKIDMGSPNLNLRDPALFRIRHAHHHRTANSWCIYPMYDYAHCVSDALEGITHSICTLEFEDHRPLYDWCLEQLDVPCHPRQIEFARLNLTYTVMSKRKLLDLVKEGFVAGWDDPRMPTISGLRRRGVTPEAIHTFCEKIGVAKAASTVDLALLESCIRDDLNKKALRIMAILEPLKVVLINWPEDHVEWMEANNNPENDAFGYRQMPFSKELYIEQDDFRENPPEKFFRLSPGQEIKLKNAYFIKCVDVIKDAEGKILELHCTYDPHSKGGKASDGRKVKGTAHWVSARHCLDVEVRLYDTLFVKENPEDCLENQTWRDHLNPHSLKIIPQAKIEPSVSKAGAGERFQFERSGYFFVDPIDSTIEKPVFNRIVSLKDAWERIEKRNA